MNLFCLVLSFVLGKGFVHLDISHLRLSGQKYQCVFGAAVLVFHFLSVPLSVLEGMQPS